MFSLLIAILITINFKRAFDKWFQSDPKRSSHSSDINLFLGEKIFILIHITCVCVRLRVKAQCRHTHSCDD